MHVAAERCPASYKSMTVRTRKFIGTVALVLLLISYSILAMSLGASQIVGQSHVLEAIYFLVAGLGWLLPAGILIRWMQRPDISNS
jgi:hypothetical protein